MNHQIIIEDLYRRFPHREKDGYHTVLEDIDFAVDEGEFVTVIGPSGCGKSTLLRILLGADHGYEGYVSINGQPVQFPERSRGLVAQNYTLYPHLTVLKNVTLGLELIHPIWYRLTHRKEIKETAMEYLKVVGLVDHINKYPHQLSGGQKQRVAISQTLITRPNIVFMDEPFGALDPSTRERVQAFLLELWEKQKMTVFFVTHDISEALILGTRLIVLSQYYEDDRDSNCQKGAKIMRDISLSKDVLPMKAKGDPSFTEMLRNIAEGPGFDPEDNIHVRDFDLSHPNAFATLSSEVDVSGEGIRSLNKTNKASRISDF